MNSIIFYTAATYSSAEIGNVDTTRYAIAAAYKINKFTAQAVYNFEEVDKADKVDYFAIEGVYKIQ